MSYQIVKQVRFMYKPKIYSCQVVERRMSSDYYRNLMGKCAEAQKGLYDCLNKITQNGLCPLTPNDEEDPLKVFRPDCCWDEDDSPIVLWDCFQKEEHVRKELCELLVQYCKGKNKGSICVFPYILRDNSKCLIKVSPSNSFGEYSVTIIRCISVNREDYDDSFTPLPFGFLGSFGALSIE